jgi:L-2-hydroxyglutarate oxidase LhgO
MLKDNIATTFVIVGANIAALFLLLAFSALMDSSEGFLILALAGIGLVIANLVCAIVFGVQNKIYICLGFVISIPTLLLVGLGVCSFIWS